MLRNKDGSYRGKPVKPELLSYDVRKKERTVGGDFAQRRLELCLDTGRARENKGKITP